MESLERLTAVGAELPIDAVPIGERRARRMRNAAHPELTYWTLQRLSALAYFGPCRWPISDQGDGPFRRMSMVEFGLGR